MWWTGFSLGYDIVGVLIGVLFLGAGFEGMKLRYTTDERKVAVVIAVAGGVWMTASVVQVVGVALSKLGH